MAADLDGQPVTCPTSPITTRLLDGKRLNHTIIGCGSYNVFRDEIEGLYDCLDCGIFFDAEEARMDRVAQQATIDGGGA